MNTINDLPAFLSSGFGTYVLCCFDIPIYLVNSSINKVNPREIRHGNDETKHRKRQTPGGLWDHSAAHPGPWVAHGPLTTLCTLSKDRGERQPAPRKSASHDSYLGEATENAQYMCWSQSWPLPWCLSHVEYNPTVTGMGIRVSMSSLKTLPLQSKPNQTQRSRQSAEPSESKGVLQEEGERKLIEVGNVSGFARCSRTCFILGDPHISSPTVRWSSCSVSRNPADVCAWLSDTQLCTDFISLNNQQQK